MYISYLGPDKCDLPDALVFACKEINALGSKKVALILQRGLDYEKEDQNGDGAWKTALLRSRTLERPNWNFSHSCLRPEIFPTTAEAGSKIKTNQSILVTVSKSFAD